MWFPEFSGSGHFPPEKKKKERNYQVSGAIPLTGIENIITR